MKTKDMPRNSLIAFCTFYKDYSNDAFDDKDLKFMKKSDIDPYDFCHKKMSLLTKLRFRLKDGVVNRNLVKQFDITLYPNSVFLISLLTNRLYTHEIIPSNLSIGMIPTRLGYVIRSSNTDAIYKNNQTYIYKHGKYIKLEEPTREGIRELKQLYYTENTTTEIVNYGDFHFSMNSGDYKKPII
jgi:hypothetical protein